MVCTSRRRSCTLMRSCRGLFGIVVQNGHCRLGEDGAGVNAPQSTKWTVRPVIFTPWARASRTPCGEPGKEGSRAG